MTKLPSSVAIKMQLTSGSKALYATLLFTLLLTLASGMFLLSHWQLQSIKSQETVAHLRHNNLMLRDMLEKQFVNIERVTGDLAARLSEYGTDEQKVSAIISDVGAIYDGFVGLGAVFEPYALDERLRLFAPYLLHHESGYQMQRVDAHYDYHAQAEQSCSVQHWYACARQQERGWLSLGFDEIAETWVVRYVQVIRRKGEIIGHAFASLDLKDIDQDIEHIDLGDEGYVVTFDNSMQQIHHSLYPSAREQSSVGFEHVFPDVQVQNCRTAAHREEDCNVFTVDNQVTGEPSYLFVSDVKNTGWKIATVVEQALFSHHELTSDIPALSALIENNHHLLTTTLVLTLIAWAVCVNLLRMRRFKTQIWRFALFSTCSFIVGIAYIWVESANRPNEFVEATQPLTSEADLRDFVKQYSKSALKLHKEPPIFIPTGVTVQTIKLDNNNLQLSGYVWQRYQLANHFEMEQGITFPESSETELELAYEHTENGYKTLGWHFRITIPEHFRYDSYPFDRQLIWLRIWPKDYREHVVLLPDIAAYDNTNGSSKPGLEPGFSLPGWGINSAFFDIRFNNYNSNFGISSKANKNQVPELHYNIAIQRNVIDPFVSYLFPVIVVLLMLYAVLLTNSKDEERIGLVGFNALEVLASSSALFFVALLAHVELRTHIGANELIYMEYFFIIAYVMVLIVSVNSILFSWGVNVGFVQYDDNRIPKLLYWPLLSGMLFLFTLVIFW